MELIGSILAILVFFVIFIVGFVSGVISTAWIHRRIKIKGKISGKDLVLMYGKHTKR